MRDVVARYGTALAGLLLVVFFAIWAPNFASAGNLLNVAKETSVLAILATGFALALLVAELDLSVTEVATLAAVVTGALVQAGTSPALSVGAGLGVGIFAGLLNGISVTLLHVP